MAHCRHLEVNDHSQFTKPQYISRGDGQVCRPATFELQGDLISQASKPVVPMMTRELKETSPNLRAPLTRLLSALNVSVAFFYE